MKRFRIFSKKTIIAGSVIFVSFLFVLMAFAPALSGAGQEIQPATAGKSYIPNPTLNTNITWNTFYKGWTPLEYNNGTGNATLSTQASLYYQNAISINPTDIQTNAFPATLGSSGMEWANMSNILQYPGYSATTKTNGKQVYIDLNSSSTGDFKPL